MEDEEKFIDDELFKLNKINYITNYINNIISTSYFQVFMVSNLMKFCVEN